VKISEAQHAVDRYIGQFAEGYWPPLTNLARLVEEVGELARELNHRYGHKPKKAGEAEQDLALELADILFVIIAIANEQQIDLEEAFARVMKKYDTRDADRWTRKDPPS
jgi:NTP pyrophosphatase (non-canonical NTP hydrolase)